MRIIINDSSALIDLAKTRLLENLLRLPLERFAEILGTTVSAIVLEAEGSQPRQARGFLSP